jgi:hypothetical protein
MPPNGTGIRPEPPSRRIDRAFRLWVTMIWLVRHPRILWRGQFLDQIKRDDERLIAPAGLKRCAARSLSRDVKPRHESASGRFGRGPSGSRRDDVRMSVIGLVNGGFMTKPTAVPHAPRRNRSPGDRPNCWLNEAASAFVQPGSSDCHEWFSRFGPLGVCQEASPRRPVPSEERNKRFVLLLALGDVFQRPHFGRGFGNAGQCTAISCVCNGSRPRILCLLT